jgi:hypothetical protein
MENINLETFFEEEKKRIMQNFKKDNSKYFIISSIILGSFYIFKKFLIIFQKLWSIEITSMQPIVYKSLLGIGFFLFIIAYSIIVFCVFGIFGFFTEEIKDTYETKNPLRYFEFNFYPKEYIKIFKRVFDNNFSGENEKFSKWINSKRFSAKELYLKLLDSEKVQKEILNEIKIQNDKLKEKERNEEIKQKRIEKEKIAEDIKVTGEIEEFFNKIN